MKKGEKTTNEEVLIEDEKGIKHWVLANAAPVYDEENQIKAGIVIYNDISELKIIENERNRLQTNLLNIINAIKSSIISIGPDRKITHWNSMTFETLEYRTTHILGKEVCECFPFFEDKTDIINLVIEKKELFWRRYHIETSQGLRHLDLKIFPINAPNHIGAVIKTEDVTHQVLLEEKLIQSEKMISVGSLAAGMAHEVNNPIAGMVQNAIVMYNRLNQANQRNIDEANRLGVDFSIIQQYMENREIHRLLDFILESGRRAARIINNMLSFARKSDINFKPNEISQLMDDAIELAESEYDLRKKYDFRKITIVKNYQENLQPVFCEKSKIEQVFLNILKNGAYAMSKIPDRASVFTINIYQDEKFTTIEIEDNGTGIPENYRKRIFEPFFTTKNVGEGTGIGLSISYFIITDNHKGQMFVESIEGLGTAFIIKLPMRSKGDIE